MITVLENITIARSQPHLPHIKLVKGESHKELPEDVLKTALNNDWVKVQDSPVEPEPQPKPVEPEPGVEEPKVEESPKPKARSSKK